MFVMALPSCNYTPMFMQATALASGGSHVLALMTTPATRDQHALYTSGRGKPRIGPLLVRFMCLQFHDMFIITGFYGQLGNGNFTSSETFQIQGLATCPESNTGEVNVPAVVACGRDHSACITRRGQVSCLCSFITIQCQVYEPMIRMKPCTLTPSSTHYISTHEFAT
jgi:alpha-tubulin suppressor-like RCC1 family protein